MSPLGAVPSSLSLSKISGISARTSTWHSFSNIYACLKKKKSSLSASLLFPSSQWEADRVPHPLWVCFWGYVPSVSHSVMSNPIDCSPLGSSVHGILPGKNTGVGCHFLLQGIFPSQESNWGRLLCRWVLYQLSLPGKPCEYTQFINPAINGNCG